MYLVLNTARAPMNVLGMFTEPEVERLVKAAMALPHADEDEIHNISARAISRYRRTNWSKHGPRQNEGGVL